VTYDVPASDDATAEYPVLVRATNGKKIEFSTRVSDPSPHTTLTDAY
jgi:hypothetical protein